MNPSIFSSMAIDCDCNYVVRLRTKDKGAIREISALPDQECDLEMTFNITNSAKQKKLHPEYHKINAPNRRYKDKYSPKYRTAHWDFESFVRSTAESLSLRSTTHNREAPSGKY